MFAGDPFQVHVVGQRLVARVDLEDLEPALPGRPVDGDVPVEAAGPQQRRVEHVGPVGGGHHDDRLGRLEAVHLAEDLVERLLALVGAAAEAGAAHPADGVDLVDEEDARASSPWRS